MPLSCGIPVGLIVIVIGAILFRLPKYKRAAKAVIGLGMFITAFTLILMVLALSSNM